MYDKNRWKKKLISLAAMSTALLSTAQASGFQSSTIATGTKQLIQDVMGYAVVLCPIVGGLAAVYFLIRRSIADEQDGKMWMKRVTVAVGCGVGGALVSGIITMLASYY